MCRFMYSKVLRDNFVFPTLCRFALQYIFGIAAAARWQQTSMHGEGYIITIEIHACMHAATLKIIFAIYS